MTSAAETMVFDRLRRTFKAPEYALLRGVTDATGHDMARTADAMAMGIWKSRGLHLHGIEIKSSRNDWLRELKDPAKADQIARFCDKWWIAIPDERIVAAGELPTGWGLILCGEKRNKVLTDAPLLDALPMTRTFLAAILRRTFEQATPEGEIRKRVLAEVERAKAAVRAEERARHDDNMADTRARLEAFHEATGLNPLTASWHLPEIATVVKAVQGGGWKVERLQRLLEALDEARSQFQEAIAVVNALQAEIGGPPATR